MKPPVLRLESDNISGVYTEREREGEGGRGVGRKIEINHEKSTCVHLAFDNLNQKITVAKCHLRQVGKKCPVLFCAAMGLAPPCTRRDLAQSPANKTVKTVPIARPEK